MANLIVAIPAYNEEVELPLVLKRLKKGIFGQESSLVLVVDDGSTDQTVEVARNAGADIIVSHERNLGVAQAYKTAINMAICFGADIVCTIDGDGQFDPSQIPSVIRPIITGEADLVIGSRFINPQYSRSIPIANRIGNKLMAMLISFIIGRHIHDTESGFRAMSRRAAVELSLLGKVSFSNDMILDMAWKKQRIVEVPVRVTYHDTRMSRVIKGFIRYGFRTVCLIGMKIISSVLSLEAQANYRPKTRIVLAPNPPLSIPPSVTEECSESGTGQQQEGHVEIEE